MDYSPKLMSHWIHTVIVSHQRFALTQRTLESWLETVSIPHSIVIVDNGSSQEVKDGLATLDVPVLYLEKNRYPGYATNRGWEMCAPDQATLLQRSDNDILYLPNWCDEMLEVFEDPNVGQFGPTAQGDEQWTSNPSWPVGGNSVIRREIFELGLRYSDLPWDLEPGEDSKFCRDLLSMGYERRFSTQPCIEYLDDGDIEYRMRSHAARGLRPGKFGDGKIPEEL